MILQDRVALQHLRSRKVKDKLFGVVCFLAAGVAVLLLVVLLYKILSDGVKRLDWSFITSFASSRPKLAGIKAALVGSGIVIILTALVAVPVGVSAAIYLEEFQKRRNRFVEFIQVNISNLAGVPSIVYGLLGLAVFVRWMSLERSVIAAALTMSLLILPMVIIVSQEALRAVPLSYREGALALGSTRWQTIRLQVLPSALPGIMTGIILSVSRAIGETAPLIVVGAFGFINFLPKGLNSPYTVLPIQIFDWASRPESEFHDAAAAAIVVLMIGLLALNGTAIYIRSRTRQAN